MILNFLSACKKASVKGENVSMKPFRREVGAAPKALAKQNPWQVQYSLSKDLSPNMGSCSIISMEIFIVGILSLYG